MDGVVVVHAAATGCERRSGRAARTSEHHAGRRFLGDPRARVLARWAMQLVLYVHNHAPADAAPGTAGRVCGMAVGTAPEILAWDDARPITSRAVFRCDATADDPSTLLQLAVAKCFAGAGAVAPGFEVQYRGRHCTLELRLEPGFDDPRAVLEPLLQLARGLAVQEGRLVSVPSAALAV